MKRLFAVMSLVVVAAFVVASCATIASGTTQSISVSSNVDGAELYLDGEQIGTTPFTGEVQKNKNTLRVEHEGYRSETISLSKSLDPVFWGNIIIGGTLGSITDYGTGAAYQYQPATYQVELQATDQAEADYRQQLVVRKFAMIYIDEISWDVSEGEGDYLSALVTLINGENEAAVEDTDVAAALANSGGDPILFGREVVELR